MLVQGVEHRFTLLTVGGTLRDVGGAHQQPERAGPALAREHAPAGPRQAAPADPMRDVLGTTRTVGRLGPLIGNRALVQLLRGPSRRASVQRLIQVQNIDYDPQSNRFHHSTLAAQTINERVQETNFAGVLNDQEKAALQGLGGQDFVAPDIPQLATLIIQHLANSNPTAKRASRQAALTQRRADLEFALGKAAPQEASDKEVGTFTTILNLATSKSRSKGTASQVALNVLPASSQAAINGLAADLLAQNNVIDAALLPYRAGAGMQNIRSPHQNQAGWLPAIQAQNANEANLDQQTVTFLNQLAANGSRRQKSSVANHFTPTAAVTGRALEDAYLDDKVGVEIGRPWCCSRPLVFSVV